MSPASLTQLLILLVFVVPGFVYQSVRISVRGRLPLDIELSTRIVRAIVTSAVFGLAYLIVLGEPLVEAARGEGPWLDRPRLSAFLALVGGIVAPSISALVRVPRWAWLQGVAARLPQVTSYDSTPTAWDKTFQGAERCFVRVLTKQDRWIAGYYGSSSYATSYPEPQQLFLERVFHVSEQGEIGRELKGTLGVLIDCSEIQLLQIVAAVEESDGGAS